VFSARLFLVVQQWGLLPSHYSHETGPQVDFFDFDLGGGGGGGWDQGTDFLGVEGGGGGW